MPKRIQFKRGEKLPRNTVYVGRPSKWGNPFKVRQFFHNTEMLKDIGFREQDFNFDGISRLGLFIEDNSMAVELYRKYLNHRPYLLKKLSELQRQRFSLLVRAGRCLPRGCIAGNGE